MKATKLFFLALFVMAISSGCLTSEEPFYRDSDIKVDDRLVGTYQGTNKNSQPQESFVVSKVSDFDHKGQYYVSIIDGPNCSMKFGAVLFEVGTNRFLDLLPMLEPCDYLAANPPGTIEFLQSITIQPMHMVLGVNISTNGVRLSYLEHPKLLKMAMDHPEYFQHKHTQFPRMVPDTEKQREFLLRFGGDTNIFRPVKMKRAAK